MKESFYFPHDTNATQDPKIMQLLSCWGTSGVGIYWILIELLHQHDSGKMLKSEIISCLEFYDKFEDSSLSERTQLKEILPVFKSIGLLMADGDYFYSDRVLRNKEIRKEVSNKRSLAGKKSAEIRLLHKDNSTSVEQVLTSVEQNSTKESKGKEKKVKEIKEETTKIPEWVDVKTWQDFKDMRSKIRKPMTQRAIELTIQALERLRTQGNDPKLVLEQSIQKSWQGVFELKADFSKGKGSGCAPIPGKYDNITVHRSGDNK